MSVISREGINYKIKMGLMFLILCILPTITMVQGKDYQIKSYLGEALNIDGFIDESERQSTGKPMNVVLPWDPWNMGGDQVPITIEIGSFHTNTSSLYLNTKVYYEDITNSNITYLLRKKGSDSYFDIKLINSITNSSLDGCTTSYSWCYNDIELGGTIDSIGKCYITTKSITFELFMPLNSSDSLGRDLSITLEDEIELQIRLLFRYPNPYGESNSYMWSEEDSCTIIFLDSTAASPLSFNGIVFGIVILPLINAIKKMFKRKNRKVR